MRIVEVLTLSKTGCAALNEDGYFFSPDFAAVIDGATSKSGETQDGKSSGRIATESVISTLQTLPFDIDAYSAMCIINANLNDVARADCFVEERPTASVAIFSHHRKEVWLYGDCFCMADGIVHKKTKQSEQTLTDIRSRINKRALMYGMSIGELQVNDLGRTAIISKLKKESGHIAVIGGTAIKKSKICIVTVAKSSQIILATDGYPNIYETLEKTEAVLKEILLLDPLCIEIFKATKGIPPMGISFDDRTYLRIAL